MNRLPLKMVPATVAVKNPRSKSLVVTRSQNREGRPHSPSTVMPASVLAQVLQPGDMLVYNNSSVLPARFRLRDPDTGEVLEMRLARALTSPVLGAMNPNAHQAQPSPSTQLGTEAFRHWRAVIWQGFTWRERTENRLPRLGLTPGSTLAFDTDPDETSRVRILRSYPFGLYDLEIEPENPLALLLRLGKPIQYSYHIETLLLWDIQTLFTGPPLSLEPPSAAFILDWETVTHLRQRGVELIPISHAAGISSVGTAKVDQQLPLAERSYLSSASAVRLNAAKAEGRRIIALGTTVARSLETAARLADAGKNPTLKPGWFETRLRLGPNQKALYCDALITGLHEETESHFQLEQAFISREIAERANALAAARRLKHHEFGDFHYLEKEPTSILSTG